MLNSVFRRGYFPSFFDVFLAIQPWGIKYTKRCGKGSDRQWFEKMWMKTVRYFDRALPDKLEGVFANVGGCSFKHGFE